jgi:hypothetical protein
VVGELQAADLALVSFDTAREGYVRSSARPAPYNVMGNAGALLGRVPDAGVAVDIGFRFGPVPAGARPAAGGSYSWGSATIDFEWSPSEERWLQSMDGQPSQAAEGGRLGADTVVFQSVSVVPSQYVDVNGSRSPEVRPVGEGPVVVLRDGQAIDGRWSRPGADDPTTFTAASGEELRFDTGQTWVVYADEGTVRPCADGAGRGRTYDGPMTDPTPRPSGTPTTSAVTGTDLVKRGMADMLKGGVIMDVVDVEQARIAEDAGAVAVMALERVPADIRAEGGISRMSDPDMIEAIIGAVSIPVMAKARIGHFVEARVCRASAWTTSTSPRS